MCRTWSSQSGAEGEALGDCEREGELDGEVELLGLELALGLIEAELLADGLIEALGLILALGESDADGDNEGLGLLDCEVDALGEREVEGDKLALGESERDALALGERDAEGEVEGEGLDAAAGSGFIPIVHAPQLSLAWAKEPGSSDAARRFRQATAR